MSREYKMWHRCNRNEQLYRTYVEELCRAFRKGYSVIELLRLLDQSCGRRMYNLLRNEGVIRKLTRKRQRAYRIPEELKAVLAKTGISFIQWANSHGLDPEEAALALSEPLDPEDVPSMPAHNALKNDFPNYYNNIYDPAAPVYEFSPEKRPRLVCKDTVIIEYSEENDCFVAYTEKEPQYKVSGKTRELALFALKCQYVILASIAKLRLLPQHPAPAFKPPWHD